MLRAKLHLESLPISEQIALSSARVSTCSSLARFLMMYFSLSSEVITIPYAGSKEDMAEDSVELVEQLC